MPNVTVKMLADVVTTIGNTVGELEDRLEAASTWATKAQAHITELEAQVADLLAQDVKTRKQLWYLQKVAKGDFDGTTPVAKATTTQPEAEQVEDDVVTSDDLCF